MISTSVVASAHLEPTRAYALPSVPIIVAAIQSRVSHGAYAVKRFGSVTGFARRETARRSRLSSEGFGLSYEIRKAVRLIAMQHQAPLSSDRWSEGII